MPVTLPLKPFGELRDVAGTGVGLGLGADSVSKSGLGVGAAPAFAWLENSFVRCVSRIGPLRIVIRYLVNLFTNRSRVLQLPYLFL